MTDHRRSAPHVARNAGPIADVLRDVLPERGLVLEVASGSGEHALHFAREFPKLLWQPSDPEPAALRSIEAWRAEAGLFNLLPPVSLDARAADWPVPQADAMLAINMVHISPWSATVGLMRGAGEAADAGRAALSLRRLSAGRRRDRAEQRGVRRRSCARAIRNGGCASWRRSSPRRRDAASRSRASSPMPANNLSVVLRKS